MTFLGPDRTRVQYVLLRHLFRSSETSTGSFTIQVIYNLFFPPSRDQDVTVKGCDQTSISDELKMRAGGRLFLNLETWNCLFWGQSDGLIHSSCYDSLMQTTARNETLCPHLSSIRPDICFYCNTASLISMGRARGSDQHLTHQEWRE